MTEWLSSKYFYLYQKTSVILSLKYTSVFTVNSEGKDTDLLEIDENMWWSGTQRYAGFSCHLLHVTMWKRGWKGCKYLIQGKDRWDAIFWALYSQWRHKMVLHKTQPINSQPPYIREPTWPYPSPPNQATGSGGVAAIIFNRLSTDEPTVYQGIVIMVT